MLELIDFFNDGQPPVSGGVLEQSATFLEAQRQLKRDEAQIKADAH